MSQNNFLLLFWAAYTAKEVKGWGRETLNALSLKTEPASHPPVSWADGINRHCPSWPYAHPPRDTEGGCLRFVLSVLPPTGKIRVKWIFAQHHSVSYMIKYLFNKWKLVAPGATSVRNRTKASRNTISQSPLSKRVSLTVLYTNGLIMETEKKKICIFLSVKRKCVYIFTSTCMGQNLGPRAFA